MLRRYWVNFQCRGVLLIWIIVGQGPIALATDAGEGLFGYLFSLVYVFSFISPSGRRPDTDRNTVSKSRSIQNNQPTNQIVGMNVSSHTSSQVL